MATVPAILGTARLGNFRLGYQSAALAAIRATRVRIFLAGVESRSRVRVEGFTIHDALNEEPNTCTFTVDGIAPTVGQQVRVTLNSNTPRHLFNGAIQTVDLSYEGRPANWAWSCQATDDLAQLDRRRPFGTWTNISATTIAQQLIATFAPGFTANHVEAALPAISINLDGTEGFSGALRQITQLIGGYFYVEDLDLHLFLTEMSDTPNPIQTGYSFADSPPITRSSDITQLRTTVFGKGHGEPTLSEVLAGETIIPVQNADVWFQPGGGQAISDTQVLTYTGVQAGGGGSVAGPSVSPSVAPIPTIVGGGSIDTGDHDYAYTFKTAAGESLPSPLTRVSTSTTVLAAPADTPTVTLSTGDGTGLTPATSYRWRITYATDQTHETTVGPVSAIHFADGVTPVDVHFALPPHGTDTLIGLYRLISGTYYREVGPLSPYVNNPGVFQGIGSTPDATLVGINIQPPAVNTATYATVDLNGIAIGPTGTTQRKVYRTPVGSAQLKLQQTIANNTSTVAVTDSGADAGLGANVPTSDTSGLTATTGQINSGSTSILTAGWAFATAGWIISGQQVIRYTGVSGNTLTGIPASGPGAIVSTIPYGDHLDPVPALTGVTGLTVALVNGAPVNIFVERNDLGAQTAMAAIDGGDGIYEYYLSDERRALDSLTALCDAHLEMFSSPIVTVSYATRDVATKSGKTIVVNLSSPPISETLTIQDVQISEIDVSPGTAPKFTVVASSVRFSLESILRRMTALLES